MLTRLSRGHAPLRRLAARGCSGGAAAAAAPVARAGKAKPPPTTPGAWLSVYMELSKSRLSGLVVMTTAAGHVMAPDAICPATMGAALGGTFLCAASANSFNQIIEVPYDALMARTKQRPLPSERISPAHATAWASAAGLTGIGTLALGTNPITAVLGGGTLALYTLVYTPMKRTTHLNTWVGSVVGALPPLMGWTAGGGSLLSPEAAVLFSALFLWQMPHFLALAWLYRADYAQGGYRMLSLGDTTGSKTAGACLEYSVYLALLPPACWAAGVTSCMFPLEYPKPKPKPKPNPNPNQVTSCMFPLESIGFNGLFLLAAWRFYSHSSSQAHARRLFLASLAYLPVMFACLLLHQRREKDEEGLEIAATVPANPNPSPNPDPQPQPHPQPLTPTLNSNSNPNPTPTPNPNQVEAEALEQLRAAARSRGLDFCPHEQMLLPTADAAAAAAAAAAPTAAPTAAPAAASAVAASRCPVVLADSAVAEARRLTGVAVVAVADSSVAVAAAQQHRDM